MRGQSSFVELEGELGKRVTARIETHQKKIDAAKDRGPGWCQKRNWHSTLELSRQVSLTAHEDHLSISWLRTSEDWVCIKYKKDVDAANKALPRNEALSKAGLAGFLSQHRELFVQSNKSVRFRIERYVFYKTSPAVPNGLAEMAPDCAELYRKAPLHHYFVIGRCENPDNGKRPDAFSAWSVIGSPAPGMADLLTKLLGEIRPPLILELFYTDTLRWWCAVMKFVTFLVVVMAISFAFVSWRYPDLRDDFYRWAGIAPNARIEAVQLDMNTARSTLSDRISALESDVEQSSFEAETSRQAAVIDELVSEEYVEEVSGGLSVEACLPVNRDNDRFIPTYLYVITLLPGGHVNLTSLAQGMTSSHALGFVEPVAIIREGMSVEAFESLVTPVSEEARSRDCRHFVLLMENDPADASRYIAQRDAVERHFYIYRPRR